MSQLCLACGLCCDGTIFDVVPVTEVESRRLTRLGVPIFARTNGSVMPQPCVALEGYFCEIYDHRPGPCRAFRCGLLDAFDSGEVSREECLGLIAETRALLATLAEALGALAPYEKSRPRIDNAAEPDPDEFAFPSPLRGARRALRSRFDPDLDRAVSSLEKHLDTHFRGRTRLRPA
jgi:hypothetical protein